MELLGGALGILKVMLGLGAVVSIHETGHFLLAKRNGVKVERFAIGFDFFGLRLARWVSGGTEYVIGAFPLGGYVKMLGQDDNPAGIEVDAEPPPGSFQAKSVWERTQIISGGVIFNFLSAFVLCTLAALVGRWVIPAQVGAPSLQAILAGVQEDDLILAIDGHPVEDWTDILNRFISTREDSVALEVERDGLRTVVQLPIEPDGPLGIPLPGVWQPYGTRLERVVVDGPAWEAGLRAGDTITSINGQAVQSWEQLHSAVAHSTEPQLELQWEPNDGGKLKTASVHPDQVTDTFYPAWSLGIAPKEPPLITDLVPGGAGALAGLQKGDIVRAINNTLIETWLDLHKAVTYSSGPVSLAIERGGTVHTLSVPLVATTSGVYSPWLIASLGVAHTAPSSMVFSVQADSPAAEAGLQDQDILKLMTVKLEGLDEEEEVPVNSWATVLAVLSRMEQANLSITVDRGGQDVSVALTAVKDPSAPTFPQIGVQGMRSQHFVQKNLVDSLAEGLTEPFALLGSVLVQIRAIVTRQVPASAVAGPVGILRISYDIAKKKRGLGDFLTFLALLSVNLAVLNILPIPALDGGHLFLILAEAIRGQKLNERFVVAYQMVGVAFILGLMLLLVGNDILQLLGG